MSKLTIYRLPDNKWHLLKRHRHGETTNCGKEVPDPCEMRILGGPNGQGGIVRNPPPSEVCPKCFHVPLSEASKKGDQSGT
jgi:hypothetical protein